MKLKTQWDYSELADAYLLRPDYAPDAIAKLLTTVGTASGDRVCDIGAGCAHLTIPLLEAGLVVDAVEPNDAMRRNGTARTSSFEKVRWHEGVGEATGMDSHVYRLVTFGSSFNVCDRALALAEARRLLVDDGWFACMWNHRSLEDPIQAAIEALIRDMVPEYSLGTRREDQTDVINASNLFGSVVYLEGSVHHEQTKAACVEAWRSHATLQRQAQEKFPAVVAAIDTYLQTLPGSAIEVPYVTRVWAAQVRT
jgi:SAM-dependent methyltransferase